MRVLSLIVTLAVATGCAESILETTDESLATTNGAATAEIVLRYGEAKALDGTPLRLHFSEVLEDSRCPQDVTCVWAGNAKVLVEIAAGSGLTHALELNTTLEPRARDRLGVRVTLLSVTPEQSSDHPILLDEYRVRLRIEPVS